MRKNLFEFHFCEFHSRAVGTCLKVGGKIKSGGGGQRTGFLRKNLYFEVILVKFEQKWGGQLPTPAPLFPTPLQRVGGQPIVYVCLLGVGGWSKNVQNVFT